MQCPKCDHVRPDTASNPTWQCPNCGIAYAKFDRAKAAFKPLTTAQGAPALGADTSIWTLIGANVAALIIALWQGWSLAELMLIYWAQSIIIGLSNVGRILNLDKFSTEGFKINDRPAEPTEGTKRQTAFFFLIHYGAFHAVYLLFIFQDLAVGLVYDLGLVICIGAFAINHWFSYLYNKQVDAAGEPNIGTLMFTPYLRIIPMHLTIIFGSAVAQDFSILLFGLLKTVADAVMHAIEHKQLSSNK